MRLFTALAAAISVRMALASPLPTVQYEKEDTSSEAARVGATTLLVGQLLGGGAASYITWAIMRKHVRAGKTSTPENEPLTVAEMEAVYRLLKAEAERYPGLHRCALQKVEARRSPPDSLAYKRHYIQSWVLCEQEIRMGASGEPIRERRQEDGSDRPFNDLMPSLMLKPEQLVRSFQSLPRPNVPAMLGRFGRSMASARMPRVMPKVV